MGKRHSIRARYGSRAALAWGLAAFTVFQLTLAVLVEGRHPEFRDPEYGHKLARLRAHVATEPGRPLLIVLGSSRAALGFRPDALPADMPAVFNLALAGAGPVTELLCLYRLLDEGLRPAGVIVEVMPPLLHQEKPWAEAGRIPVERLSRRDVVRLQRHAPHPGQLRRAWLTARLTPWFSHRFGLLSCYAPRWLAWDVRQDRWRQLDRAGWMPYPRTAVSAEEVRRAANYARLEYAPCFQRFHITANADRALRELLVVCRRKGIGVWLLTMPESSAFRGWYPPSASPAVTVYLKGLSQEYGAEWIDARSWMTDEDFVDGHHLLASGATAFTKRFGRKISLARHR
jgi:hypothetical protein